MEIPLRKDQAAALGRAETVSIPALERRVLWLRRQLQRLGEIQRHQRGDVGAE